MLVSEGFGPILFLSGQPRYIGFTLSDYYLHVVDLLVEVGNAAMLVRLYLCHAKLAHRVVLIETKAVLAPMFLDQFLSSLIHDVCVFRAKIALELLAPLVMLQVHQKVPITVLNLITVLRLALEHQLFKLLAPVARRQDTFVGLLALWTRAVFLAPFMDAGLAKDPLTGFLWAILRHIFAHDWFYHDQVTDRACERGFIDGLIDQASWVCLDFLSVEKFVFWVKIAQFFSRR